MDIRYLGLNGITKLKEIFALKTHTHTKSEIGLGNVENKSSATIRGELTKANVTTALGYTPPTSNTWRGIQNNLTSTSTTDSLAAAQGKVLKDLIDGSVVTQADVNALF